jgi:methyl-accepting chemotaxis protein
MFKRLRLWANILLVIGAAIVIAITTLTLVSMDNLKDLSHSAEEAELRQLAAMAKIRILDEVKVAEAMATMVASIPEVQARFAAGDRDWLGAQLHPAYEVLAREFGVVQFQFHVPPATSFLRLHMLEKFGDDLSGFRQSVIDVNRDRVPQRGLEFGVGGLGVRAVVPVADASRHVGSVEFGMSFGQTFFDQFKADHGVDVALYVIEDDSIRSLASTHGDRPLLGTELIRASIAGPTDMREFDREGVPSAGYAEVINDYSGRPLGVLEIIMDRSGYVAALNKTRTQALFISLLVTLFSIAIALFTAHAITKRIGALAGSVQRVADGDLTYTRGIDGGDELAELARVVDAMRTRLNDLVAGVQANADSVFNAAREIARSVDGQAATSSEMSASVAEITSTMEELSASSTQIAEYSESVVAIANRTYEDSVQGSEAMQRLVDKMRRIGLDNQNALNEIVALGSRSKEISKIMEIIDTVADQTRLIAFNAALEASSAGEAGKRFGVVAAEIRRLADSVSESTGEITAKVGEIQESINRLVISSEKGSAGIQQGMADSASTAEVLQALVAAAGESSSAAQQISLSTQQQRTASNQVVVALREIVTASSETAGAVHQIAEFARELKALSGELKGRMERFSLDHRAAQATTATDAKTSAAG